MKKLVFVASLVGALFAVAIEPDASGPIKEYNLSPLVKQVKPAVFRVMHMAPGSLEQPVGGGSGSIVSPEGYGYTNFHVTTSAKSVVVTMDDNTECPAKVLGTNVKVDFALLKIECPGRTEPYPYVKVGDSNAVQKNEVTFAIGSPGDRSTVYSGFMRPTGLKEWQLINTVTAGIIRDVQMPWQIIQAEDTFGWNDYGKELSAVFITTATINHGNSGGPSFNARGEQIGINSWGSTEVEADSEIMPVNDAHKSADDILHYGRVIYPWAGIFVFWSPEEHHGPIYISNDNTPSARNFTQDRAMNTILSSIDVKAFMKKIEYPVEVRGVFPGSPAAKAGLARDDLIYTMNGERMKDALELTRKIRNMNVGDGIELYIRRGDVFRLLKFDLEEQPQAPAGAAGTA